MNAVPAHLVAVTVFAGGLHWTPLEDPHAVGVGLATWLRRLR
ncbi:hypothetical protein [Mycobacterium sp.]|nr:hypothetical protein [Mycobacterium sp.]